MESSLKMTCLVTSLEKYIFNLFLFPNVMCLCFYVVEIEAYMSSLILNYFLKSTLQFKILYTRQSITNSNNFEVIVSKNWFNLSLMSDDIAVVRHLKTNKF